MEAEVTRYGFHTESRMRETRTYGSMRGSRRKTAKSVLRVVADRAGVPHGASRSTLHPIVFDPIVFRSNTHDEWGIGR